MNVVEMPVWNRADSADFLRGIAQSIEDGHLPVPDKAAVVLNFDNPEHKISVFVFGAGCNGDYDGIALMVLGQQALCDKVLGG